MRRNCNCDLACEIGGAPHPDHECIVCRQPCAARCEVCREPIGRRGNPRNKIRPRYDSDKCSHTAEKRRQRERKRARAAA